MPSSSLPRSSSSPSLPLRLPRQTPSPLASIIHLAHTRAHSVETNVHENATGHQPPVSSTWSPLIRWVENPLRLHALAVYTVAANAGVSNGSWRGLPLTVLRRSGEWHNLIPIPRLRPSVSYIKQVISHNELALAACPVRAADTAPLRARGVEWFLLAQLCVPPGALFTSFDRFAVTAPSQISLQHFVTAPALLHPSFVGMPPGFTLSLAPTLLPPEQVPVPGFPWGVSATSVTTPMLHIFNPESLMQLLVQDHEGHTGAAAALLGVSARRVVASYVDSLALAVPHGMAVSLHTLHANDVLCLLINEAALAVPPNSPDWFCGVDAAILHLCRDELLAWLREHNGRMTPASSLSLLEFLRLAQSSFLQAFRTKFEDTGAVEGLAVACFEEKITICAKFSFHRLISRLQRGDPTQPLVSFLEEKQPRCASDLLLLVQLEEDAAEALENAEEATSKESIPPSERLPPSLDWMTERNAERVVSSRSEIIRSEPRAVEHSISPNPHSLLSVMDEGLQTMLSNRPDKVVWMEKRDGGYWRCLFPWILLTDSSYTLSVTERSSEIVVHEISEKKHLFSVRSYEDLERRITETLEKDVVEISRSNQVAPDSWLDADVRASLLILIAGARGILKLDVFSPCLRLLVEMLRALLFIQGDRASDPPQPAHPDGEFEHKIRTAFFGLNPTKRVAEFHRVEKLYLPSEVHTCHVRPPVASGNRNGWFGIRWHEETFLIASGSRERNVLHAEYSYMLLNSNTFDLQTHSSVQLTGEDKWVVGAMTTSSIFQRGTSPPCPRMECPHIELGAHTLIMMVMAAERALNASIGVLWTTDTGVVPAVVLRGPLSVLEQLAAWVPGITVLGNGYRAPPALLSRKERQYFSRGRFAARVWSQDQLRAVFARHVAAICLELGVEAERRGSSGQLSTYVAHAIADAAILLMHVRDNLPVRTVDGAGWTLPFASSEAEGCMKVSQRLMLPLSTAVRPDGEQTMHIAVDSENMLTLQRCSISCRRHEMNELEEYAICPGGVSYERIATGTVEDAGFFQCRKRVLLGPCFPKENEGERR